MKGERGEEREKEEKIRRGVTGREIERDSDLSSNE